MRWVIAAALGLVSFNALAGTIYCKAIEPGPTDPAAIQWDTASKEADLFVLMNPKEGKGFNYKGQLTLVRDHDASGKKYNFKFTPNPDLIGDEAEYILYPEYPHTRKDAYVIRGIYFKDIEGQRYMNADAGKSIVICEGL